MPSFYSGYVSMYDWFASQIEQALHDNNLLRAYYFLDVVCPLLIIGINNKLQQESNNFS